VVGALWMGGACLAWGLDANLMGRVSARDPAVVSAWKLLAGGAALLVAAVVAGDLGAAGLDARFWALGAAAGVVGVGVSHVLFLVSLRAAGTARTAVWFGTAPFLGAVVSATFLREAPSAWTWVAGAAMAVGVGLVAREGDGSAGDARPGPSGPAAAP
jgi:drug/metabolite transporter (DMT)-like permease